MINIYLEYDINQYPIIEDPLFELNLSTKENKDNTQQIPLQKEKNIFPFQINSITSNPYIFKNSSFIYASKKHLPLLQMLCSHILYVFAIPIDYDFEQFFNKAQKFWDFIKYVRIIKEHNYSGKYSLIIYFKEQNNAEEFFHVFFFFIQ